MQIGDCRSIRSIVSCTSGVFELIRVSPSFLKRAALTDFFVTGSPNGGTLGIAFGLVLVLVLGVLGASFLVAAAVAAPG